MKFGLVIGHSRYINGRRDGGAVSAGGAQEWDFNSVVARIVEHQMRGWGHVVNIYDKNPANGYTRAMIWIGNKMKEDGVQCAVEMHFNYLDGKNDNKGHGHEYLYWHTSTKGKFLAQCFNKASNEITPDIVERVILPRKDGRGAAFLENTYCPAVVAEPFFGDDDWDKANADKIAAVYVSALLAYAEKYD